MILFIIIAIGILIYTTFKKDWLIDNIRKDARYEPHKCLEILTDIGVWFGCNIILNIVNIFVVFVISFFVLIGVECTQPPQESEWSFEINALRDNLVTEGEFHGSIFGTTGSIDGEISYFYSRTMSKGEKIEHIPANKTYIRHSNDEHPHVEVHQSCIDIPKWMEKVFFLKMFNDKTTDYYVIVAPEGTITNTGRYEIDME